MPCLRFVQVVVTPQGIAPLRDGERPTCDCGVKETQPTEGPNGDHMVEVPGGPFGIDVEATQAVHEPWRGYHSSLIGQNGKYVTRLEEKYGVKITFPREAHADGEGKTREQLKADEVLVKGGRKGVAQAKQELMDAVEFEKEYPSSAAPRS
ncbi:hypothetical protein NUW54_g12850 [Trametes sanguinea]|uniref:Uncharacterized protein n=1 Tax=Trametes sanguinea TaxID=158606 RepID=A0ACC1MTI3_9APHY|nr:hypothetical protein NUW54_g12850 [Trametes sanguinea]